MAGRSLSDKERGLFGLPARAASEVVTDLVAARKRWLAGEDVLLPRTTFHLRSGRDVTGWVVDARTDAGGRRTLLVHLTPPDRGPSWDVCYLDAATVEALTVHDAPEAAHIVSEGKVAGPLPSPDGTPAPTRLELKRLLAEQAKNLSSTLGTSLVLDVPWNDISDSGEPLRVLRSLITDTVELLREISADPLGKESLQRLEKVWFGEGGAAVLREGTTLVVVARLAFGPQGRLPKTDLKRAIEKAL